MLKQLILALSALIGTSMSCIGQVDAIRAGLEKRAARTGQPPELFHEIASLETDKIYALPSDGLKSLQPLLEKCLKSGDRAQHDAAHMVLMIFSFRFDGAELLDPYIDLIAQDLQSSKEWDRTNAISLLSLVYSKPSDRAIAILKAIFTDPANNTEEFQNIAMGLLCARPEDSKLALEVLTAVRKRKDDKVFGTVMQVIGLRSITTNEALEFIKEGLNRPETTAYAMKAIEQMPRSSSQFFVTDLARIAADPSEKKVNRDAAQKLLKQ